MNVNLNQNQRFIGRREIFHPSGVRTMPPGCRTMSPPPGCRTMSPPPGGRTMFLPPGWQKV